MGHDVQQHVFRRFLFPIISLAVLLAAGTAGYRWMESLGTIDALYMTVITISTVGFGEVKPLSPTGRLFTIGLIFSGGGLVAYTPERHCCIGTREQLQALIKLAQE